MEDARSSPLEMSARSPEFEELSDDDLDEVAGGLARAWLDRGSGAASQRA